MSEYDEMLNFLGLLHSELIQLDIGSYKIIILDELTEPELIITEMLEDLIDLQEHLNYNGIEIKKDISRLPEIVFYVEFF